MALLFNFRWDVVEAARLLYMYSTTVLYSEYCTSLLLRGTTVQYCFSSTCTHNIIIFMQNG
jgi:hypothetical protein